MAAAEQIASDARQQAEFEKEQKEAAMLRVAELEAQLAALGAAG